MDEGWRRPPTTPYVVGPLQLRVTRETLRLTVAVLRSFGALEGCCFWYGSPDDAGGEVSAVIVPRQINRQRNYHVDGSAMVEIANTVRTHGWKNLSQVHSHPGTMVEHSPYDDQMAVSRHSLSVVFPRYGNWGGQWSSGVGVHEWQEGYWHLLVDDVAAHRVAVVDDDAAQIMDFRR